MSQRYEQGVQLLGGAAKFDGAPDHGHLHHHLARMSVVVMMATPLSGLDVEGPSPGNIGSRLWLVSQDLRSPGHKMGEVSGPNFVPGS